MKERTKLALIFVLVAAATFGLLTLAEKVKAEPLQHKVTVTLTTATGSMQMECSGPVQIENPTNFK